MIILRNDKDFQFYKTWAKNRGTTLPKDLEKYGSQFLPAIDRLINKYPDVDPNMVNEVIPRFTDPKKCNLDDPIRCGILSDDEGQIIMNLSDGKIKGLSLRRTVESRIDAEIDFIHSFAEFNDIEFLREAKGLTRLI